MKLTLKPGRRLRHYVARHSSAGWNPVKNKKILFVYGLLFLPLLAIGGSSYALFLSGGNGPAASINSVNLQKGLVGWWKLDGNAKDSTPYGDDGIVHGATLTTDRNGKSNGAYSFNGSSYIDVSTSTKLNVGNSMTASAWFYPTTNSGYQAVFSKANSGGTQGWEIANSNGFYRVTLRGSTLNISTGSVTLNKWHMLSFTYSGTTLSLYVDGVVVGTASGSVTLDSTADLEIGSRVAGGAYDTGSIDDARLYNRALSASEITALYNEYDPGVKAASGENGLVGWWKMDGNAKDATPNGNNGTVTGATLTTDREGKANSAYSFDGTSSYIQVPNISIMSNSFSASLWFKTTTTGDRKMISTSSNKHLIQMFTGGDLRVCINTCAVGTHNFADGLWHYAVVEGDSTSIRLYVDGSATPEVTEPANPIIAIGGTINFGRDPTTANYYYGGLLDDVRIYNRALSLAEMAAQYNSYNSQVTVSNLQSGLVGDWAFNGNAKDSTPYSDNGTVNGATLTTDRKGRPNSAYSFNGTNNYIYTSTAPPLTTSGTLSAWVRVTSWGSSYDSVIFKGPGLSWPQIDYTILRIGSASQFIGSISDGTNTLAGSGPKSTTIVPGQWYQLVFSWDGTTANFYTNGVLSGSVAWPHIAANRSGKMDIGMGQDNSTYPFNGSIDDVRIWNRALSAAEVQALYQEYN